jgi:two-component system cell cycle response regulator
MRLLKEHYQKTCIPWRMLGWLFALSIVLGAWYVLRPFRAVSDNFSNYLYSVVIFFYPLLMTFLCFKGSPNLRDRSLGVRRFIPALFGMGVLFFALAELTEAIIVVLTQQAPPFTVERFLIENGMYPFLICAILLLPSRGISRLLRVRLLLDSLCIMIAIATLIYYFVVAPLLVVSHGTLEEQVVLGLSPLPDLVLIFCLLAVGLRSGEAILRPIIVMLLLAEIFIFTHDAIHFHETLYNAYNPFSLGNLAWGPALTLIVGAAQTTSCILKKEKAEGETAVVGTPDTERKDIAYRASNWKAMLAPALVLLFCVEILIIWITGPKETFSGRIDIVYLGAFVVLVLTVLRQFLMLYEIGTLHGKLQQRNHLLDHFNIQLKKQATTDPLTGLPNHREMVEQLDRHLATAQTSWGVCSVVFMDIDHFKTVNDHYGHAEGDEVLRCFATLVRSCLREEDCVGRWGGEEFVAILPDTDTLEALNLAECVRQMVEEQILAGEKELNVTCSLGVACYPQDATRREELIARADQAMYTAKRLGRNQVRTAHEPEVLMMKLKP